MRLTTILLLGFVSLGASGADVPSIFNTTNRTLRTLSLDECIRQALEHNLRIQVKRFDPSISRFTLEASRGVYDPEFSAQLSHSVNTTEGRFNENTGLTSSGSDAKVDLVSPGISGLLPSGLTYDLGGTFTHGRGSRSGGVPFENYTADVSIQLEQPLLKNFFTDSARTVIQINRRNLRISELGLEAEIRLVTRDVQVAYYELMFSREDVKVQEKALELANKLVSDNKARVEAQKLAPLDVKQSESQAATALADYIQAQRRVLLTESVLKNLISDDYQGWLNKGIEPAEKLVAVPEHLDLTESWASALNKRPDILQLRLEAEKLTLNRKLRSNQRLPELNLIGGYGRNGVDSSTPQTIDFTQVPPVTNAPYSSKFSSALDDIAAGRNERYNVGVLLRFPIGNKTERNRYRSAVEQEKQIELELRKLNQDIIVEVDNVLDSVRANYERVSATHQARLFAELALDAGQKRLEAGIITSFEVLSLQKDLTTARSNEIRALADYNRSLSQLYYSDGTILERNKISVQFK
jgi:outer membrane protein TolC